MADDGGFLNFLKDTVPDLAVAVGDTVTGGAVSRIADAVGLDTDDPKELKEKLQANPELQAELKKQERRLAVKELRIKAEDRQSARRMAIKRKDPDTDRMAYFILGAFFVTLSAVIAVSIIPSISISSEVLMVASSLVGIEAKMASDVVAFYFGSSSGSKDKDRTIADQVRALNRT